MNQRDATIRVLAGMAMSLRGELDNGSGWIFGDDEPLSEADTKRMVKAVGVLADSLDARAARMRVK